MEDLNPQREPAGEEIARIICTALAEDIGGGDVTTLTTIPEAALFQGDLVAKADGIVAGLEVARLVFAQLDPGVQWTGSAQDGEPTHTGDILAHLLGPGRALLTGERVALNLLQRMSGIATLTRRYVDAVQGTHAAILDTRKTAPGLRALDKWAVRLGGGQNHRSGLYDMALIKDNHIAAVGSIGEAVRRVRVASSPALCVEVEVTSLDQLREALSLPVDRIMLDNMTLDQMRKAVGIAGGRIPLEASGKVTLRRVGAIARTGVDYISCGALTHSVKALDISLELRGRGPTHRPGAVMGQANYVAPSLRREGNGSKI
jgi:nicotinate-nucleotide pyrophosphorylase (carboxylating)